MYPTTLDLPVELLLGSPGFGHVCVNSSSDTAILPRKCRQSTEPAANTGFWKSYPIKLIPTLAMVAATITESSHRLQSSPKPHQADMIILRLSEEETTVQGRPVTGVRHSWSV